MIEFIALTLLTARIHGIDYDVATRLVYAESRYDPRARNGSAVGLGQINLAAWPMDTWVRHTIAAYDPYSNLYQSMAILAWLMERYAYYGPGAAVAAYAMGHGAMDSLLGEWGDEWKEHLEPHILDYVSFVAYGEPSKRWGSWRWIDEVELLSIPKKETENAH